MPSCLCCKMSSSLLDSVQVLSGRLDVDALEDHALNGGWPPEIYNSGVLEQDARMACRHILQGRMMDILRRWIYSTGSVAAEDIMADAEKLAAMIHRGDFVSMDNEIRGYDSQAITLLMIRRHGGAPAVFEEALRRLVVERNWLVSAFRYRLNNIDTMDRTNLPKLFVEDCEMAAKKAAELDAAAASVRKTAVCCACECHRG